MYRRELENLLKKQHIPTFFLLFGADEYQIELFGKEIIAKYKDKNDVNLLNLYFDEYDFEMAKSHLEERSLFGGKNILYIKSDKKINQKELKVLIEACEKNDGNFLFELYESDTKITSETQRAFGNNFARFFKPSNFQEAAELLVISARKLGLNISQGALYELYAIHNENLYLAASELNKLSMLNEYIDEQSVKSLVYGLGSVNFDDFFNKFLNLKPVAKLLEDMTSDVSFNEIFLINSLYKAFYKLFKLHSQIKISGSFDIKSALGYAPPPNIANILKQQSLAINLKQFHKIFVKLNESEYELKTNTNIDKNAYIISVIISLQNIISSKN